MKNKNIIIAARLMSSAFTPFYLPMVGLMALLCCMSLMTFVLKLLMLCIIINPYVLCGIKP